MKSHYFPMIYGFSYDFLWVFLCFHTFFHAFPSKKHLKKNRPPATPRQPLAEGRLGGRYGFIIYTIPITIWLWQT